MILPKRDTALKLFLAGGTVGPVVDSLHNQCLLKYDIAPISIPWTSDVFASTGIDTSFAPAYFFCSSWLIPPLLGAAYVVLGGILPALFRSVENAAPFPDSDTGNFSQSIKGADTLSILRTKGLLAVTTTAMIILLSEFLQTHSEIVDGSEAKFLIMLSAAIVQWLLLDGTKAALLVAVVTSVGGPLSELPFVAHGCWHYLPPAADYLPLSGSTLSGFGESALRWFLGENYRDLSLSSITGPCYFAVTMDAIALGRWFDSDVQVEELP